MEYQFCPECGTKLDENAAVCPACGTLFGHAEAKTSVPSIPTQPHKKESRTGIILFSLGGMFSGIASIILGIIVSGEYYSGWESNISYQGDAYTGIQNAAAQTANNVLDLTRLTQNGIASLLIIFGLFMFFHFGEKMCRR